MVHSSRTTSRNLFRDAVRELFLILKIFINLFIVIEPDRNNELRAKEEDEMNMVRRNEKARA